MNELNPTPFDAKLHARWQQILLDVIASGVDPQVATDAMLTVGLANLGQLQGRIEAARQLYLAARHLASLARDAESVPSSVLSH